ncbi:hypothetical protein CZ809_02412 [Photobacterium piscicola]|uniref:Uncharacterized protein n=1 Tax=Photobacterium piscicola TaxID=1378299 RepID=A0A1T5I1D5_9GAMM|nr:hypothetical protein CZ809_02412 [Photobacterium piscicola]
MIRPLLFKNYSQQSDTNYGLNDHLSEHVTNTTGRDNPD